VRSESLGEMSGSSAPDVERGTTEPKLAGGRTQELHETKYARDTSALHCRYGRKFLCCWIVIFLLVVGGIALYHFWLHKLWDPHAPKPTTRNEFPLPSNTSGGGSGGGSGGDPNTPRTGVCKQAEHDDNDQWAFDVFGGAMASCTSSAGGNNDLGTTPHMCDGDYASIRIETTTGLAECLSAFSECTINMYAFESIDYDLWMEGCNGFWATPLWMNPTTWRGVGSSGEVDTVELCLRDSVHSNFADGGHQIQIPADANSMAGHVTTRKDKDGIITVKVCTLAEAASNGGQCLPLVYSSCNQCMQAEDYACYCNIYGSDGCAPGTGCTWDLFSDIWNGIDGNGGYKACMSAASGVVQEGQPNWNGHCMFSAEHVTVRGTDDVFVHGSPGKCKHLRSP